MDSICKMTPWLMAIFCLVTAGCTNPTDQQTSETSHDQQVAILKQIRKVNEDGSYTFGYEAGDGSFKVESRDVLGNIKGTFGFVDAEGEIKRVSYSSSNGTGFRSTTVPPLQEQVSVVQTIPRLNLTTTTRKPSIVYATEASARSSVVQTIPRLRKTTTTSTTTTTTTTTTEPPQSKPTTYYGHYVKAQPSKTRPRFGVHTTHQRPPPQVVEEDADAEEDEDSQINRPVTEEKDVPLQRRIIYAKRPVAPNHSLRPITEEFEEHDEDDKVTTGNTLRRQLSEDATKSDGTSEVIDEHADVYGGALTVSRPLFTTSTPPRLAPRVTGLRTERPKTIYVNQNNLGPAKFDHDPKYEDHQVYGTNGKDSQEERNAQRQQILFRAPQRAPVIAQASRDYVKQSSEPIYVREDPNQQQFLREIPPEGIIVEARRTNDDEDGVTTFRQVPLGRILFRPLPPPNRQSIYQTTSEPNQMRYLAESTTPEHIPAFRNQVNPNYLRSHSRPLPRPLAYQEEDPQSGQVLDNLPQRVPEAEEYSSAQDYSYTSQNNVLPPEPQNTINPPLSRRDFQILLKRLLISQYGARALIYPRTYLEDALYDQQSYPAYHTDYQTPAPRQSLLRNNLEQAPLPVQYGERLAMQSASLRRPSFSRALNPLNPIYQPNRYEDYQDNNGYTKRVYRQKFYPQEPNIPENEEVLPPSVREALLLRMLQLAINRNRSTMPAPVMTTTPVAPPVYRYRKMGPVRNVQIITDDSEEDRDLMQGNNM